MGEFDLIEQFFAAPARARRTAEGVALGIGDDCALLSPAAGMQLALSADMLVEGRHFLSTVAPERLGHKALAVNLSDLAAAGARPLAFLLSLALPSVDAPWLEGFSRGLFALADAHGIALVGGDTTRGPLNISITVIGEVPQGAALLRSGARAGDDLWVSGHLGDARLALEGFRGTLALPGEVFEAARARMEMPTPRVALGQALRGVASAAVDVSDGLLGDVSHVLRASKVGARLEAEAVVSCLATDRAALASTAGWSDARALEWTLAGGDDYELAFTAPPERREAVLRAAAESGTRVTRIGRVEAEAGVRVVDASGARVERGFAGFDHFG